MELRVVEDIDSFQNNGFATINNMTKAYRCEMREVSGIKLCTIYVLLFR